MSLGGALLLQSEYKKEIELNCLIMVCTSLHYEHALKTMYETWYGFFAIRVLVSWQFWSMFNNPNFLHNHPEVNSWIWAKLYFAANMLAHDKILSKLYDFDYRDYLDSLDLRKQITGVDNLHYLYSKKDPMFSPSHQKLTEDALKDIPNVHHEGTDFGFHGEFTKDTRNGLSDRFLLLFAVNQSLSSE